MGSHWMSVVDELSASDCYKLIRMHSKIDPPGMFRAGVVALRGVVRSHVRAGFIDAQHVIEVSNRRP